MTAAPRALPANPSITHLKNQAKDLKAQAVKSETSAVERIRAFHPTVSQDPASFDAAAFTLRDAQVTVAREYGFESWQQLNIEVGERMVEERDLHRWFGVQLNNGMWDNIEDPSIGPDIPQGERETLLYSAYASAYHWRQVGSVANHARGEHLIARMAVKLGDGEVALRHARRCLELIDANPDDMEDWDAPFGHEALARALAATGDRAAGQAHRDRARELTDAVEGEADRQVLESELDREPWFGLR